MRTQQKIKKEYSLKDKRFPLDGEKAKRIIKASGLTYKQLGEPVGVSDKAISNWVNNVTLAPKNKVKKVFSQLGMNSEEDIDFLILHHPSEEVRQELQQRHDYALERARKAKAKKEMNENMNLNLKEFADQVINLTQVVNQVDQRQKEQSGNWATLFTMLNKISEDQAKQQSYLVNEIRSLKKEVQQKNVLIRELHR